MKLPSASVRDIVLSIVAFVAVSGLMILGDWLLSPQLLGAVLSAIIFVGVIWQARYGYLKRLLPNLQILDYFAFAIPNLVLACLDWLQRLIGSGFATIVLFAVVGGWGLFFMIRLPQVVYGDKSKFWAKR
jgi:hypothetical protein